MTIWQNQIDNSLHDDMNGEALNLPNWPQGMIQLTDAEVAAIKAADLAAVPPQPNQTGFIAACKSAVGGILAVAASQTLATWSLVFNAAVLAGDWADVQALIVDANSTGAITPTQYSGIKAAVAANNIAITLP